MHPHAELITRFYTAFQKHDADAMIACYHPDVTFNDPAFVDLHGERAGGMWRMLLERGKDMRLTFSDVTADDTTGSAHWEAWYTFSASKRPVHNIIDATFRFKDGKIIDHRDQFDFWRWSSQALGTSGKLLGWSPFLKNKVRQQTRQLLDAYMSKKKS